FRAGAACDADSAVEASGASCADPCREEPVRRAAAARGIRDAVPAGAGSVDAVRGADRDELSGQIPLRALARAASLRVVGDELAARKARPRAARRAVSGRLKRSASARKARAS